MFKLGKFTRMTCVFAATLFVALAFAGCSKDSAPDTGTLATTAAIPEVTEIDAFLASVKALKSGYDENNLTQLHVQDAAMQAMVVQGFLSEQPDLYQSAEYKSKIQEIDTLVNDIDPTKAGLEDFAGELKDLKKSIETLNNKANK